MEHFLAHKLPANCRAFQNFALSPNTIVTNIYLPKSHVVYSISNAKLILAIIVCLQGLANICRQQLFYCFTFIFLGCAIGNVKYKKLSIHAWRLEVGLSIGFSILDPLPCCTETRSGLFNAYYPTYQLFVCSTFLLSPLKGVIRNLRIERDQMCCQENKSTVDFISHFFFRKLVFLFHILSHLNIETF